MRVLQKLKALAQSNRIALVNCGEQVSYAQLNERSDAFAAWLLETLGSDRSPIVICAEKENDALCCILGALKSGRAYVPIDSVVPNDRAMQIISDVYPKLIVDLTGRHLECNGKILYSSDISNILGRTTETPPCPDSWVTQSDIAYILFTSGSTGRPKGVPITASNIEAFCHGILPFYSDGGVILNQVSYSFDVSGCAVYAGLACGMTLFTIDHKTASDYGNLLSELQKSGLTMWVSTPSFAEICLKSKGMNRELLPHLKQFLFCGEVLTHTLCSELAERFPTASVLNTYGPTESTILVTATEITEEMRTDSRPIPIGKAIDGATLRLVDEQNNEITDDEIAGELIILGPSVSPGYFARPDLTEKTFFHDVTSGLWSYRTGDLCMRSGEQYYYCGRADNQLKINGFRVELEDIENNLEKLENILRAAVVPVWSGEKVSYLVAFLLLRELDGLTPLRRSIQLKKAMAEYLPSYMIPRQIFVVDSFPLNVNGKIDRKALSARLAEDTP